jgi:SpoVK/Ycf46/Vps4 family AAA+-type ATPase
MGELKLNQNKASYKSLEDRYDKLIGLDVQKEALLFNLKLILDNESLNDWKKKHHPKGLSFLDQHFRFSPLLILSGEVGCGKTELANCIAGPLVHQLGGKTVKIFSTPSDLRGSGLVGQLSARITSSFEQAKKELHKGEKGILILDEADDIATARDQEQAHHEDKAGVNALIKEIDRLGKDDSNLAVILISNRSDIMDPAILRRATQEITFRRPLEAEVKEIIQYLLKGIDASAKEVEGLVAHCMTRSPLFSYSDFFNRIGIQAIRTAYQNNRAFSFKLLEETIITTNPSPTIIKT